VEIKFIIYQENGMNIYNMKLNKIHFR